MGIAEEFADAFKSVTKALYREKKRRERDARRTARRSSAPSYRVTLKDAVFMVMDAAADAASGGGATPFSVRTLYYQVRPRIQGITSVELNYGYFSQQLVVAYEAEIGPMEGLYYEPRGEIHEPHTGKSVPIEDSYIPPEWTYDKVLYVEKTGLWPVLRQSQLAERYDMAIFTGNGYATEACRHLLAAAEGNDIRLFVLHDADPHGYNIGRTVAEATRRMPDHNIEIADLGLTVAHAIELDLPTEPFTRKMDLPETMHERLDETELEWFEGTPVGYRGHHECLRVELNALTSPALIEYIEQGLDANDATAKLVPPDPTISAHAAARHRMTVREALERIIAERLLDALTETLIEQTADLIDVDGDYVRDELEANPPESWRTVVEERVDNQLGAGDDDEKSLDARCGALLDEQGIGGGPPQEGKQ